jgi:hypothetical protein
MYSATLEHTCWVNPRGFCGDAFDRTYMLTPRPVIIITPLKSEQIFRASLSLGGAVSKKNIHKKTLLDCLSLAVRCANLTQHTLTVPPLLPPS